MNIMVQVVMMILGYGVDIIDYIIGWPNGWNIVIISH